MLIVQSTAHVWSIGAICRFAANGPTTRQPNDTPAQTASPHQRTIEMPCHKQDLNSFSLSYLILTCARNMNKVRPHQTEDCQRVSKVSFSHYRAKLNAPPFCTKFCALLKSLLPQNNPTKLCLAWPTYAHSIHPHRQTKFNCASTMVLEKKRVKQHHIDHSINH